jgi:hypothetical protein
MAKRLRELEQASARQESEREKMRGKLSESVRLLKEMKREKETQEERASREI